MTYGLRYLDDRVVEVCDDCGFDARFVADEGSSLEAGFLAMSALLERPDAKVRPAEDVWSAAEYAHHLDLGIEHRRDLDRRSAATDGS